MTRRLRKAVVYGVGLAVVCGLLAGPCGTLLQVRVLRVGRSDRAVDAVYLVAGANAQDRRVGGLVEWLKLRDRDGRDGESDPLILIGNDTQISRWSRARQRNLCMTEWAIEKLVDGRGTTNLPFAVVPGIFHGTDGEMTALSAFLAGRTNIHHVALLSSPYHLRRCVNRLQTHLTRDVEVSVIPIAGKACDRYPWVVAGEWLKMLRDWAGLSQGPMMSRGWFMEDGREGEGRDTGDGMRGTGMR